MSHLTKIVELNTALINDKHLTCPVGQAKIVDSAVVRAVVAYSYMACHVDGAGLTEAGTTAMTRTVEMWNEVSPLGFAKIFSDVNRTFQRLYNQALAGGEFQPIDCDLELDFDPMKFEPYVALFRKLLTEMVEYNK